MKFQIIQQLINTHIYEIKDDNLCTEPLLSVWLLTYNHKDFIDQAINSVLVQQTNFSYEIVIGDDCSTDGTTEIIRNYQSQYPNKIRLLLAKRNLWQPLPGIQGVTSVALYQTCRGKYIALCEGDDYWTDPLKLQKQIDFLENNPDFAICFHKVKIEEEGQFKDYITGVNYPTISSIVDLAKSNYIPTPSCVFRNNIPNILGANFSESPLGDYYIHMMNAQYGNIFYIDEVMAIYRVHNTSTFSSQSMACKLAKTLKAIEVIYKDLQEPNVDVRRHLIDLHIFMTINIYNELLLMTDFENTVTTFCPNDYRLRLIEKLMTSKEEIKILEEEIKILEEEIKNSKEEIKNSKDFRIGHLLLKPCRKIKQWFLSFE
jgi:glycosyltransferase involved in cell wall biosynthesis